MHVGGSVFHSALAVGLGELWGASGRLALLATAAARTQVLICAANSDLMCVSLSR